MLAPLSDKLIKGGLESKLLALLKSNMDAGLSTTQAGSSAATAAAGSSDVAGPLRLEAVVQEFGASVVSERTCRHAPRTSALT